MSKPYKIALIFTIGFSILWFRNVLVQPILGVSFQGKIWLSPLGKVPPKDIQLVKNNIQKFYGFKVKVDDPKSLPQSAYFSPRNRYVADILLNYLQGEVPDRYDKVIGVTAVDIQTNTAAHKNWGVLGLAKLWQKPCIVSTYRIKGKSGTIIYNERLSKVALHEVGHVLGLPHCNGPTWCFMQDARGKLNTIDNTRKELCSNCKSLIAYTRQ